MRALTKPAHFYEVGGAVILGVDMFCAVRLAWYQEDRDASKVRWQALSGPDKQRWIETADAFLQSERPAATRGPLVITGLGRNVFGGKVPGQILPAPCDEADEPRDEPALCIWCSAHDVLPEYEPYCSTFCAAQARCEGA